MFLGGAGGSAYTALRDPWPVRDSVADVFTLTGDYTFTFVATDSDGLGMMAGEGALRDVGGACTSTGRFSVGNVSVNPASDPIDIRNNLDVIEDIAGVGRIYTTDHERVELPDGSDGGSLPLPWLEPVGSGRGMCEHIAAVRTVLLDVAEHATVVQPGIDNVDMLIYNDDRDTQTRRWIAQWDRERVVQRRGDGVDSGTLLDSRVEIAVADKRTSVYVRKVDADTGPGVLIFGAVFDAGDDQGAGENLGGDRGISSEQLDDSLDVHGGEPEQQETP